MSQSLARRYGMQAEGGRKVINTDAQTRDIVKEVLATYNLTRGQSKELARGFNKPTVDQSARAVWSWIRKHIRYKLDPIGLQISKSPAKTLTDGFADCKAMSILAGSILFCLGIPHKFRFTSYDSRIPEPTHVYVVALDGNREIPLDPVMSRFAEKRYAHKKDYMPKLVRLTGIGQASSYELPTDRAVTEGELDLYLMIKQLEAERDLMGRAIVSGVGSLIVDQYDDMIAVLDLALSAAKEMDPASMYQVSAEIDAAIISGVAVGGLFSRVRDKIKETAQKVKDNVASSKPARVVRSAARKVAQSIPGIAKAITAPQRAMAKTLIEKSLPIAAPAFLPLFIKDPQTVAALPADWKARRQAVQVIANFITDAIGMKDRHFMQIVRTGITKKMGGTPEVVLEAQMQGVSGIGAAAIVTAALSLLPTIIEKISGLFKSDQT